MLQKGARQGSGLDEELDAEGGLGAVDPGRARVKELSLENVSLEEALKQIADRAGLEYRIDEHAITLGPKGELAGELGEVNAAISEESEMTQFRLNNIIVPVVDFDDTTVLEALSFLRSRARELDVYELDPAKRGIEYNVDALRNSELGNRSIGEMKLRNVPIDTVLAYVGEEAGLDIRVMADGRVLVRERSGEVKPKLRTLTWEGIPDELRARWEQRYDGARTARGGFDYKEFLMWCGVSFPEGGTVRFLPGIEGFGALVVTSDRRSLDLIGEMVDGELEELSRQTVIEKEHEKRALQEPFSTFSLHISDVSFKLAKAALARGEWPEAEGIRVEEFVNAFDYGDPSPTLEEKVACQLEQATHPFMQQRNLVRISMRTAALGRAGSTPLSFDRVAG